MKFIHMRGYTIVSIKLTHAIHPQNLLKRKPKFIYEKRKEKKKKNKMFQSVDS